MGTTLCRADAISEAAAALDRGDLPQAEHILTEELRAHPTAPAALSLLGVVLDEEKKFQEADGVYARALAPGHPSPGLLNNYGNHLAAMGDDHRARLAFEKVLLAQPGHPNANAQVARIEVAEKEYRGALLHLDRLPPEAASSPAAALIRLQALYGVKRTADAEALLQQLAAQGQGDPQWTFSLGLALASAGQYAQAETFFTRTLEAAPANADVLYNLGLAASRAGDRERALTVFEAAEKQRPDDVDLLYNLGALCAEMDRKEAAIAWLAQAGKLDPKRADVQLLLAHTSSDLGYDRDSLAAWDQYLKLKPEDDVARRERAFEAANVGSYDESIAALRLYLARHPNDALAHYDLGAANLLGHPDEAMKEFDRALTLQPNLTAALAERGLLKYQRNDLPGALRDLEAARKLQPNNPTILDHLSQAYLLSGAAAEAVVASKQAAELAPNDRQVLLHLGLALARSGDAAQAREVMSRVREVKTNTRSNGGLVQFLSQSPQERDADLRAKVEKAARENPTDMTAQVGYLRLLLQDGKNDEAAAVARRIGELNPSGQVLLQAGSALLAAEQWAVAREILSRAVATENTPAASLDLALATFHTAGPAEGLHTLDTVPAEQRHAEFFLAQAKMLEAAGQTAAALAAVAKASADAPSNPDVCREATVFLLAHDRLPEALATVEGAVARSPNDPNLQMIKAITLQIAARAEESGKLLEAMEHRWPEWYFPWLIQSLVLGDGKQYDGERRAVNTAMTLGADSAEAYACLAEVDFHAPGEPAGAADAAVHKAIELDPENPWSRMLASRIALLHKDDAAAVEQSEMAVKLAPGVSATHAALAEAYRAAGQTAKAEAESALAQNAQQQNAQGAGSDREPLRERLFRVLASPQ